MDKENPQGTGVKAKRLGLKAAGLGVLNTVRENAAFLERNAQEKPKEKPKEKVEPHVAERIAWIKKRWPRESNDDYDRRVKQALGAQFVKECKKAKEDHISSSVLRALIEAGADPNHKDEYELTALYYASKAGASRVCNELLLAGCDTGHRKAVYVDRSLAFGVDSRVIRDAGYGNNERAQMEKAERKMLKLQERTRRRQKQLKRGAKDV